MKKIAFLFFAAAFSFSLISCDPVESTFNEMESICEDIELNFDEYTEDKLEEITSQFAELEEKMSERELTNSEQKKLAKLKGRYAGIVTKNAIKGIEDGIKKFAKESESIIEGFMEAFE